MHLCPKQQLSIVIATIASGMGLDCPDVYQVVQSGPSRDIDSCVQKQKEGLGMDIYPVLNSFTVTQTDILHRKF